MEIGAGGPNEDQDGKAEAAEEQLLEPGNPQEQVPKVRNPDKEVQTSILSFSKKNKFKPRFQEFSHFVQNCRNCHLRNCRP